MRELLHFLQSFSPVSDPAWQHLQRVFSPAVLKKGAFFTHEGTVSNHFAFLKSGVLRGFYRGEKGQEYNKHFFTSPCMIGGYTSLVTGQPNQIIQQAMTDCEILLSDYAEIEKLYTKFPDLERVGRKFAERYFVEKETKEFEIILYDAMKRYVLFQTRYPGLEQLVPQYHIASYLGITPTQLSRIRKKMAGY